MRYRILLQMWELNFNNCSPLWRAYAVEEKMKMSNVVTKDISAKLSYTVSTDLIDYAQSHDSDQAEALLDAVENNEDALELYKRAKAFFDLLVEQDILDPEDLEDMVGSLPDKKEEVVMDEVCAAIEQAIDVVSTAERVADELEELEPLMISSSE